MKEENDSNDSQNNNNIEKPDIQNENNNNVIINEENKITNSNILEGPATPLSNIDKINKTESIENLLKVKIINLKKNMSSRSNMKK